MAAFETGFHQTIRRRIGYYADPVRVGGEARRPAVGLPRRQPSLHRRADRRADRREAICEVISCHLGGSSSLAAIDDGKSVGDSMGMSPQSGLPHNNRVGDFDPFALPAVHAGDRAVARQVLHRLGRRERASGTVRREQRSARHREGGGEGRRAGASWRSTCLSVRCAISSARIWCGSAAPTRSSSPAASARTRRRCATAVCDGPRMVRHRARRRRRTRPPRARAAFRCGEQPTAIWTMPTNEEIVVARQTSRLKYATLRERR